MEQGLLPGTDNKLTPAAEDEYGRQT